MLEAGYAAGGDGQTVHWVVSHPEIEVFVAADRTDKVVGLISMSHRPRLRESGRIAMIEEIIVTQDWRRKGIGSALLKHAIERARVLSVRSLELLSRNEAPEVLEAFYAKAGFQPTSNRVFRLSS